MIFGRFALYYKNGAVFVHLSLTNRFQRSLIYLCRYCYISHTGSLQLVQYLFQRLLVIIVFYIPLQTREIWPEFVTHTIFWQWHMENASTPISRYSRDRLNLISFDYSIKNQPATTQHLIYSSSFRFMQNGFVSKKTILTIVCAFSPPEPQNFAVSHGKLMLKQNIRAIFEILSIQFVHIHTSRSVL